MPYIEQAILALSLREAPYYPLPRAQSCRTAACRFAYLSLPEPLTNLRKLTRTALHSTFSSHGLPLVLAALNCVKVERGLGGGRVLIFRCLRVGGVGCEAASPYRLTVAPSEYGAGQLPTAPRWSIRTHPT